MATFRINVFRHQEREDGKYPVSIRVYWRRRYGYIGTEYYVTINQISQNKRKGTFELKDTAIISELTKRIDMYEKAKAEKLGLKIYNYSAPELARYFERLTEKREEEIDFIKFANDYHKQELSKGRNLNRLKTVINSLSDYCKDGLPINNLTSKFLIEFAKHLQSERILKRKNQLGRIVITTEPPISDSTLSSYMTEIRTVFNLALKEYNDDDTGDVKIFHYPFKKYKIIAPPITEKRNIPSEDILKIIKVEDEKIGFKRAIVSRDVFVMSFLLVGMNLKDLYELRAGNYKNGRFTYKRAKTKGRRKDDALISIKIEPELLPFIEKYKDNTGERVFIFYKEYATSNGFVASMSKGLKTVANACEINADLSSYYARHSWATIGRNKCRIPKSDIDECLNHVSDTAMADIYIEKDWSFIDEYNRKVIDYVYGKQ